MRRRSLALSVPAIAVAGLVAAGCGSAGSASPQAAHQQRPPSVSASVSAPIGATVSSSPSAPASAAATSPPAAAPAPSSPPAAAPAPPAVLAPGMSGAAVLQLQQRLAALKYYPGPADGQFGSDTEEAVWAFQETQGLPTSGTVGPQMQAALADPRSPAVLVPGGPATRVEVNLADEVLVLYQGGQIALVSHVSSGGGYYFCSPGGGCGYAVTPAGDFQTTTFMPGWVTVPLGEMYNPVFFIGTAFAIHGDTDVPLQPVSHGCVRIPMDIAQFFYTMVPTPGTPVYIRG
jgi:Putative peptidoglycan binding domain/L,D-transpeptidase catalytic domain